MLRLVADIRTLRDCYRPARPLPSRSSIGIWFDRAISERMRSVASRWLSPSRAAQMLITERVTSGSAKTTAVTTISERNTNEVAFTGFSRGVTGWA